MGTATSKVTRHCPEWCLLSHSKYRGEENLVHVGEPVALSGAILARLCMSMTPDGEVDDEPYVLVGTDELTLEEVRALGERLIEMAAQGAEISPPATA